MEWYIMCSTIAGLGLNVNIVEVERDIVKLRGRSISDVLPNLEVWRFAPTSSIAINYQIGPPLCGTTLTTRSV